MYSPALILIFAFSLSAQISSAQVDVKMVKGDVTFSTKENAANLLREGASVGQGATIKTSSGATADLVFQDSGTVLRLLPNTELELAKLNKTQTGEQTVSETSVRLLSGTVIGSQRKLAVPSHFDIITRRSVATITGTEYIVRASGDVTVLSGSVSVNYLDYSSDHQGMAQVIVPKGSSFDSATLQIAATPPQILRNLNPDINRVREPQTFKRAAALDMTTAQTDLSPTKGNNGVGNGTDGQPNGNPPPNDGPGTGPGSPGNKGGGGHP